MIGPPYAERVHRTCANCHRSWWTTREWVRWSALAPNFFICPDCR